MVNRDPIDARDWLTSAARDPAVGWSVGTFGALAEFSVGPGETPDIDVSGGIVRIASDRGALRFDIPADASLIAYEGLSKMPAYWSQGLSLCLPADRAALSGSASGRTGLSVIGPDRDAVRDSDRQSVLVDLGIGSPHIEACVRIGDAALLETIRPGIGKSLFTDGHRTAELLYRASPHRVFRSCAARIEVYGPIPHSDDATPDGPHTHLLPDLLAHGRPYAATVPIPQGWLPVLNAYPPNPARDSAGDPCPFDRAAHNRWLGLMDAFGPVDLLAVKRRIAAAVGSASAPRERLDLDRFERTAARVAIRQLAFTDGESPALAAWRAALGPGPDEEDTGIA